uniref:Uncharacterized protein n=1 Tax=Siphoviridae sp. ctBtT10 TaxID=2827805 RepID=A0A8S5SWW3_9CAUD|nr:MAG TPA: hypothetical protein [Siphoviridae sp. ctBtT10]
MIHKGFFFYSKKRVELKTRVQLLVVSYFCFPVKRH